MGLTHVLGASSAVQATWALLLERGPVAHPAPRFADEASGGAAVAAIDAYIERHMHRLHVPGAALAIVEGDRIVHLRGFGMARPGGEAPSPQTPFILGSTTKSFTALAVMQLVEAGKIVLDAPVQRYLPWFRVADAAASARITVRHLLNQTSGLPQLAGAIILADLDQRAAARERQARALATLGPSRPPGTAWEYSNLNYLLLGLVIEAASGASYEAYVQDHVFAPLGMRHSYTTRAAAERDGLAVGHRYWFAVPIAAPTLPVPRGPVPAGYLISSAENMARYLIAHLNDGRYGDAQVLSPDGIAELHRPAVPARMLSLPMGSYGMGWFVEEVGQGTLLWHDGTLPDFFSYMALVPESKRGVVLLVNANHMLMNFALLEVGKGAGALLAGAQPRPIRLGIVPWVLRALPLIPALQYGGLAATRRSRDPSSHPTRGAWGRSLLLPLIPNLLTAFPLLIVLRRGMLRMLLLFMPDVTWIALIAAGLALARIFRRGGPIGSGPLRSRAPGLMRRKR